MLASLLVSLAIPLITFIQFVEIPLYTIKTGIKTLPENPLALQKGFINYVSNLFWIIYFLGVAIFTVKFSRNLTEIFLKIKRNKKLKTRNSTQILLEELVVPHTFLNYIFLNRTHLENREIPKEVLIHEEAHVAQKHTLDILFIEICQIILWFHPLIYMLKKTIKLNHEFLADQKVIQQGISLSKYQQILLAFSSNALEPRLATAINYSFIKKRFTVMKT
ncbi:MAG: M56 family metallopeptidase, partial [Xanthomarina sp.]